MVTGVDLDPSRQAVLRATVAFAREVGARVVAEGIEHPEELEVLREAEVDYGQGWLFGRPAGAWPEEPSARPVAPPRALPGRLERELASATTAREASEAIVEHLARKGLMPSVYLEDGGRLRCQAVRGYWQIYDGMPATAGVIGRTFRTGEETVVGDVADSPDYLPAIASVHAEVCVPLRVHGVVAGVLNAESPTQPGDAGVAEIRRCGRLLSARLEALGGLADVSAAQRLARIAVRLGSLETAEDIVRETVAAARSLAGFESAMLALPDGHGGFYVRHAEGSFAVALGALEARELERIAAGVDRGTSSYTAGDTGGRGFEGHEVLREAGANAVIVLPLVAAGERHGLLVVADRADHRIDTEQAELLELLAGQAAGSLRMAAAVTELRERAARDPLTGLGHHATFYAEVPEARASAPAGRRVVVLLADVDGFKAINDSRGHAAGDDVLRAVAGVLRGVSPAHGRAYRIGGDEFAILFECAGEAAAWRVGWDLQAQARSRLGTTVSIGLAIAVPGESDEQLVARADAALYEVKRRGRDGVLLAPPALA
jgi:diguanylate cyclase (GGDEF)-like protein